MLRLLLVCCFLSYCTSYFRETSHDSNHDDHEFNHLCRKCLLLERNILPTNVSIIGNIENRQKGGGHPAGFVAVIDILQLLYIPLPKCGSTSWRSFSRAMGAVVTTFDKLSESQKNYEKFTLVRDPISRFFSGLGTMLSRTCTDCFTNVTGMNLVNDIIDKLNENPLFDEHMTPASLFLAPFLYNSSSVLLWDVNLIPYEDSHVAMTQLKAKYLEIKYPNPSKPIESSLLLFPSPVPSVAPTPYFAYDIMKDMNIHEGHVSGHHTAANINPITNKELVWDDLDIDTQHKLCRAYKVDFQCFSCFNKQWHQKCPVSIINNNES